MKPSLYYFLPSYKGVSPPVIPTFFAAAGLTRKFEIRFQNLEIAWGTYIHRARSAAVNNAMSAGAEFLLMHDDDTAPSPLNTARQPVLDGFYEIFENDPKVGAVGAPYLSLMDRKYPWFAQPVVKVGHPDYAAYDPWPQTFTIMRGMPAEPFEVLACGTGFMVFRMEAFKSLQEPWFRMIYYRDRWGRLCEPGEDVNVCLRLRREGWKIICDPRVSVLHCKDQQWMEFFRDEWEARETIPIPPGYQARDIGGMTCLWGIPPQGEPAMPDAREQPRGDT